MPEVVEVTYKPIESISKDLESTSTAGTSPPDVSQPYEYRSLESNDEIRLLRFLPRDPESSKDLHCEIIHVDLESRPNYRALSYTWGSPDDPHFPVFVNGQTFLARQNLWLALNRLEDSGWDDDDEPGESSTLEASNGVPAKSEEPGDLFWIDAVCIDQSNIPERNVQVMKMKSIYEQAEEVVVWLGPREDDTPVFEVVRELHESLQDPDRSDLWMRFLMEQPRASLALSTLAALLGRSYWWRMWIVQELVVARRAIIYYGNDWCTAEQLYEIQKLCARVHTHRVIFNSVHESRVSFQGLVSIYNWKRAMASGDLTLLDCLTWFENRSSGDPRDKMYALASLVDQAYPGRIAVDYALSTREVYTSFARSEMLTSGNLSILTRAMTTPDRPSLPSWVADWSRAGGYGHDYLRDAQEKWLYFRASKDSSPVISFDATGQILTLRAVHVAVVKNLGKSTGANLYMDFNPTVERVLGWWRFLKSMRGSATEVQEAFGRTLRCGKLPTGLRLTEEDFYRGTLNAFVSYSDKKSMPESTDAQTWTLNAAWLSCVEEACKTLWDRRFFLSDNIMGVVPREAMKGDIVCVPLGCPHPMLFRRVEAHYVVIGEAYVDGYMHGKAIDLMDSGELEMKEYELW